ncbi:MAG: hypothetical protein RLZZ350_2028 [Verrucomicrobiota bacterium]|jgi:Zn-finger nucleic acid-binding protein
MRCPACEHILLRFKTGNVVLDACHHCGGLWFDAGELAKVNREQPDPDELIADFPHRAETRVAENSARPCPRCVTATLTQKLYSLGSGVIMDCCPDCRGLWLDRGELEKIREALRHTASATTLLHQIKILHR